MLVLRRVRGPSMQPTLPQGKLIVGVRIVRKLKPGHVIIFRHEGKEMIKRVYWVRDEGIFVLGDEPEHSIDSRHFGVIQRHQLVAKVVYPKTHVRRHRKLQKTL